MYANVKLAVPATLTTVQLRSVCNNKGTCKNMNPGAGGRGRGLAIAKAPVFGTDVQCVCDKGYMGAQCSQCAQGYVLPSGRVPRRASAVNDRTRLV